MPPSRKRKATASKKKETLPQNKEEEDGEEEEDRKPAAKKTPNGSLKTSTAAVAAKNEKPSSPSSSSVAAPAKEMPKSDIKNDNDDEEEEGSLDIGACSLCHCALDYSDKAAFFQSERETDYSQGDDPDSDTEDYFFRPTDPYLPVSLYNPHNALVYCDSCDRLYHQKCHFVPLLQVPRGHWKCLVCCSGHSNTASSRKRKSPATASATAKSSITAASHAAPHSHHHHWTPQETSRLFLSPPIAESHALEQTFECQVAHKKAQLLTSSLKRLKATCGGQLALIRLAQAALQTYGTARNRKHFSTQSQELQDTAVKLWSAKYKLRQAVVALDGVIRGYTASVDDTAPGDGGTNRQARVRTELDALLQWTADYLKGPLNSKHKKKQQQQEEEWQQRQEFVTRVLFPFGRNHTPRLEPRTPEQSHKHDGVVNDDNDSGISLDDLTCCVCLTNTATDDNDLVLCDGQGCCRAYHMKCVVPALTAQKLHEEDDWFCPLCLGLAETMLLIQTEYKGEDWEQRRLAAHVEDASLTESLQSWSGIDEVFPESALEYEAACALREGQRNATTDALLANLLGYDDEPQDDEANANDQQDDHDDEEEEDDDDHFDLDSFQERRRQEQEGVSGGDNQDETSSSSSHSSQATLVDMSSVELEIGKDELAALSDQEEDDEEESDTHGERRKSRRLRKSTSPTNGASVDPGKLDASNILTRKRGRKPVDYILLNQAIFGDLSDTEVQKIDDGEEFEASKIRDDDDSRNHEDDESGEDDSEGSVEDSSADSEADDDNGRATNGGLKSGSKAKSNPKKQVPKKQPSTNGRKKNAKGGNPKVETRGRVHTKQPPKHQTKGAAKKPSRRNGKH